MYNVLHILTGIDGGISAMVRNYYTYIDKEKIHFDLACITEIEGNDIIAMRQMGAEVFHLPMKSFGIKEYVLSLKKILNRKKYDAVHVHENETSYIALKVAKQQGVKCRVAHSHTSCPYISIISEIRRLSGVVFNYHYATTVIGCGVLSGERIFGKWNMKRRKALILPNTIDFKNYAYDEELRLCMRKKLGLSNQYVIGMVGRLSVVKNQLFALKLIKKYHETDANIVLILIGDGEEEENIRNYIVEHQMERYVTLMGKVTDVEKFYQVFDVLILPSLHEGYPLVAIEALVSGLPILMSSNITDEFRNFRSIQYISLNKENDWLEGLRYFFDDKQRPNRSKELPDRLSDIEQSVKKLENIYCDPRTQRK